MSHHHVRNTGSGAPATDLRNRVARVALALAGLVLADAAVAVDFPVSGTLTINGTAADLPDGGVFAGSSYDASTGVIADGGFVFPQATLSFDTPLGTAVATYVLSQTNASSGEVWSDSTAALTPANLILTVLSLTVSIFPVDVGDCVLGPMTLELAGTASTAGLQLGDAGFEIPEVAPGACGDYGDEINGAIAGTNNQAMMDFAGDFTPPSDTDTVFADGFDP